MNRPANTPLTPEITREVCQRAQSKAFVAGSIAALGTHYALGLKAVNCQSGDTLAEDQVTAASKEKVLSAVDRTASRLRGEIGESLATVQKFDVPLAPAPPDRRKKQAPCRRRWASESIDRWLVP